MVVTRSQGDREEEQRLAPNPDPQAPDADRAAMSQPMTTAPRAATTATEEPTEDMLWQRRLERIVNLDTTSPLVQPHGEASIVLNPGRAAAAAGATHRDVYFPPPTRAGKGERGTQDLPPPPGAEYFDTLARSGGGAMPSRNPPPREATPIPEHSDWARIIEQDRPIRPSVTYKDPPSQPQMDQARARSPAPSRCSNASAARIRLAEQEAEEQLLRIQQKELELQKQLIKSKLAKQIAMIEAEDAVAARSVLEPNEKVDEWFRRTAADFETPQKPKHESRPRTNTHQPQSEPRKRSPTPARDRSASSRRGIDKLAEALEKMTRMRPPPRQVYELPTFSGAAGEWLPFQAAYEESTKAYNFTPTENVARLRSCLRGTPRETVAALLHTATDPEHIMRTLRQCYGRPEVLVDKALDDLKKLPRLGSSATDLNTFAVKLQNIVSVLSTVENRGYLYNPLLARETIEKMSPHLRSRFCDYASEQMSMEPEICALSKFLMREADRALRYTFTSAGAAATTTLPRRDTAKPSPRPPPRGSAPWATPRAPIYTVEAEDRRRCLCCGGEHETPRCRRITEMDVNQRWEWARDNKVCFRCMDRQHRRETCRARTCEVNGCRHVHHPLLHANPNRIPKTSSHSEARRETSPRRRRASPSAPKSTMPPTAGQASSSDNEVVSTTTSVCDSEKVLLKMVKVKVSGPNGTSDTFALLDDGSTVTLIDEELAREIGVTGTAAPMKMRGIASTTELPHSRRVNFAVQGRGNEFHIAARTVKNLKIHKQSLDEEITKYNHLQGLNDAVYEAATPRLLIGADNWHLMIASEARTGKRTQPAAVRTELGWVIYGSVPRAIRASGGTDNVLYVYNVNAMHETERLVEKHFAIDALGVSLAVKQRPADERAQQIFKNTVKFNGKNYEVGLPWKTDEVKTPASYNTALQRLRGVERKMKRDPKFADEYAAQIRNLLEKGYAEEIQGEEINDQRAWVLPHFAVRNINKPGKLRLVFDAASRSGGKCLNDFLLEGPDLLQSLPGILFRFREGRYAVTADIQEMFLRVKIRPADQPAQMFLWKEPGAEGPPKIFKMSSMIFGASSSPFLAHSVRNYNAERHATEFPEALYPIKNSHYMDDYVDSYATEDEAVHVASAVTEVHQRAGFILRSWNTNSEALRAATDPKLRADKPAPLGPDNGPKILGLMWDPTTDSLGFNTAMNRVPKEVRDGTRAPTKREALSAVMSIYDPLGLLSTYTITAKIILQRTWQKQVEWDAPLATEEGDAFIEWARGLSTVAALRLRRSYKEGRHALHVFVDASESAYAAAAYLRTTDEEGAVTVTLVAGKAKVAPLKPQSIPRMELQAAVIGARLAATIIREQRISIDQTNYWSDSRTVLQWIRHDAKRYTPFVAHRLGEIAELTQPTQWRWVPTRENPADDATRANGARVVACDDRWYTGPDFLRLREDQWPQEPSEPEEIESEVYMTNISADISAALPNIERFSNLEKLVRATAQVLLFIQKCQKVKSELSVELLTRAEELWYRRCQNDSFSNEITVLRNGGRLPKKSRLFSLDPVVENGLIRMRGRINAAPVPNLDKRPVILDGRHPFVRLLIEKAHRDAAHSSNERVVNDIRQRLWVLHLRPTVRKVARECRMCAVRRATPRPPAMGDLPRARIEPYQRPFTNTGVDYFGPITVTIGRRHEKRWVALFTCLTTRAVHLEVAASLSTDSAIMALRRMAARRGWPHIIYSDNGTNFKGADNELRAAYEEWLPELRDYAMGHRTEWRFIPPGAPNQGGAWERLVRSVKTALAATLASRSPKEEVLHTLLAEAEQTVNSRPLTHVSVDPHDEEALTPNHFLISGPARAPLTGACDDADRRTWRASQALADHFWARWVREYLPMLAPRNSPSGGEPPLRVGDVVIVVDANLPRNVWPRGVVEAVFPGPDGGIRSADVRTKGGVFRRPTTRLAVLPIATEASPTDAAGGECCGQPQNPAINN